MLFFTPCRLHRQYAVCTCNVYYLFLCLKVCRLCPFNSDLAATLQPGRSPYYSSCQDISAQLTTTCGHLKLPYYPDRKSVCSNTLNRATSFTANNLPFSCWPHGHHTCRKHRQHQTSKPKGVDRSRPVEKVKITWAIQCHEWQIFILAALGHDARYS